MGTHHTNTDARMCILTYTLMHAHTQGSTRGSAEADAVGEQGQAPFHHKRGGVRGCPTGIIWHLVRFLPFRVLRLSFMQVF